MKKRIFKVAYLWRAFSYNWLVLTSWFQFYNTQIHIYPLLSDIGKKKQNKTKQYKTKTKQKKYCWHFWFKSHSGALRDAFCHIIYSFLLILITKLKSSPKTEERTEERVILVTLSNMKNTFHHFWPKITIMTLLAQIPAQIFWFSTFIYFASSIIRSRS